MLEVAVLGTGYAPGRYPYLPGRVLLKELLALEALEVEDAQPHSYTTALGDDFQGFTNNLGSYLERRVGYYIAVEVFVTGEEVDLLNIPTSCKNIALSDFVASTSQDLGYVSESGARFPNVRRECFEIAKSLYGTRMSAI